MPFHPDPPLRPALEPWRLLGFVLLAAPLVLLALPEYQGSSDLHAAGEIVGGAFGLIAGVSLISRAIAVDDRVHLFFGVGFFATASTDLLHGGIPFLHDRGRLDLFADAAIERFIPGSYVAGRLMLAIALLAAPALAARMLGPVTRREAVRLGLAVSALGVVVALAVLAAPLPNFLYPAQLISRPADLVAALLLLVAVVVLAPAYRRDRDPITGWVLVAAIASVVGQLVMSLSDQLYDRSFQVAHIYKIGAYGLPLLGISLYQVRLQVHLEEVVERLRDLDAAKNEFLSVVSHELKTPLTAVVGFSSLLEEYWTTIPEAQKLDHIAAIRRQGSRLQRLIDDLLLVSSIQAGEIRPHRVQVALHDEIGTFVRAAALQDQVAVDVDPELHVRVDTMHLATVLEHLVDNAFEYGGAPVVVRAWAAGGDAVLVVDDAGPGVPEEIQDRLFRDRFVQGDRGETRTSTGTGLGLAIVGGLAEANGAEPFHDRSPAGGARVGMRLPLVAHEQPVPVPVRD